MQGFTRKAGQGILTVRFEMPFPIWCTTCPKPTIIGQGVRFNAEKKKVGNYYSTPVLSFRMKHVACGGWIEIRTDPKNTAYVVHEGAKKRDTGEDKVLEGDMVIQSAEEREKLQNDAFAMLEGRVEEKRQTVTDKSRIEELWMEKEKDWDDPYAASRKLRKVFRAERKGREEEDGKTEDLKDRMSLGMELLAESEDDRRRAGFVDFGVVGGDNAVVKAKSKPLFSDTSSNTEKSSVVQSKKVSKAARAAAEAQKRRADLQRELGNNTRAVVDPFLIAEKPSSAAAPLIKRRRREKSEEHEMEAFFFINNSTLLNTFHFICEMNNIDREQSLDTHVSTLMSYGRLKQYSESLEEQLSTALDTNGYLNEIITVQLYRIEELEGRVKPAHEVVKMVNAKTQTENNTQTAKETQTDIDNGAAAAVAAATSASTVASGSPLKSNASPAILSTHSLPLNDIYDFDLFERHISIAEATETDDGVSAAGSIVSSKGLVEISTSPVATLSTQALALPNGTYDLETFEKDTTIARATETDNHVSAAVSNASPSSPSKFSATSTILSTQTRLPNDVYNLETLGRDTAITRATKTDDRVSAAASTISSSASKIKANPAAIALSTQALLPNGIYDLETCKRSTATPEAAEKPLHTRFDEFLAGALSKKPLHTTFAEHLASISSHKPLHTTFTDFIAATQQQQKKYPSTTMPPVAATFPTKSPDSSTPYVKRFSKAPAAVVTTPVLVPPHHEEPRTTTQSLPLVSGSSSSSKTTAPMLVRAPRHKPETATQSFPLISSSSSSLSISPMPVPVPSTLYHDLLGLTFEDDQPAASAATASTGLAELAKEMVDRNVNGTTTSSAAADIDMTEEMVGSNGDGNDMRDLWRRLQAFDER
ncbi:MAG: hypothetical protein Q9220_000422 [cf. Caloplaca sp. 1 TL-2023]